MLKIQNIWDKMKYSEKYLQMYIYIYMRVYGISIKCEIYKKKERKKKLSFKEITKIIYR